MKFDFSKKNVSLKKKCWKTKLSNRNYTEKNRTPWWETHSLIKWSIVDWCFKLSKITMANTVKIIKWRHLDSSDDVGMRH